MEIVPLEELESKVIPLLNELTEHVKLDDYYYRFISRKFDYLKVISNPYGQYYCIEPIKLQQSLSNVSSMMGDSYIYMSFVGYDDVVEQNTPLNFKFLCEELLFRDIDSLIEEVRKITGLIFTSVLVYSSQGLWATLTGIDCYGTIGMSKQFLNLMRIIYPQLDTELDKQLLDFIAWCGGLPDEWEYTVLEDHVCYGWCRGMMEYLCKRDIDQDIKSNENIMDIIEAYRNIKI